LQNSAIEKTDSLADRFQNILDCVGWATGAGALNFRTGEGYSARYIGVTVLGRPEFHGCCGILNVDLIGNFCLEFPLPVVVWFCNGVESGEALCPSKIIITKMKLNKIGHT